MTEAEPHPNPTKANKSKAIVCSGFLSLFLAKSKINAAPITESATEYFASEVSKVIPTVSNTAYSTGCSPDFFLRRKSKAYAMSAAENN